MVLKNQTRKGVGGKVRSEVFRHEDSQPLRVVLEPEALALSFRSDANNEVDTLRRRIEHVAYNGHDGYVCPSVRSRVPKPYLDAIATLDAIRRGADLRGSGGDPVVVALTLAQAEREV